LATDHTTDSLAVVKKNLAEKKAVLIDVREVREWNKGHLEDAQLQPLSALDKTTDDATARDKLMQQLPKEKIIYCHCARGARAQTAGDVLSQLGYDVRPLAAGFEELVKQGFKAAEPGDAK
jgi:rhodanese-related sulfurtransferase